MGNCVACSVGRPTLYSEPAPLFPQTDKPGFRCMIELLSGIESRNCSQLSKIFPPISNYTRPPPFKPGPHLLICFSRSSSASATRAVGMIPKDRCNKTYTMNTSNYTLSWARADLYWSCGGGSLLPRLPIGWWGRCAIVRLATPVFFLGHKQMNKVSTRQRRSTYFDLTKDGLTYIDSIGIPRGVPDEFKLADQIAAGFENIPLLSALFPITLNKNVDRINYVNYNVLRLANLTREQLESNSLPPHLWPFKTVWR